MSYCERVAAWSRLTPVPDPRVTQGETTMSQRTLTALALAAAGALAFTIVGVPAANGAATEVVDPVAYRSAECKIPINPHADPYADPYVQLQQHSTALAPGQSIAIENLNLHQNFSTLIWESTNESVATVNWNGVVTALTPGDAQVTAAINRGKDPGGGS